MRLPSLAIVALLAAALFLSCNNARNDAEILAKKVCQCQVMEKALDSDKGILDSCWNEALHLAYDMRDKYKDDDEALEVFDNVLNDAEKNCSKK